MVAPACLARPRKVALPGRVAGLGVRHLTVCPTNFRPLRRDGKQPRAGHLGIGIRQVVFSPRRTGAKTPGNTSHGYPAPSSVPFCPSVRRPRLLGKLSCGQQRSGQGTNCRRFVQPPSHRDDPLAPSARIALRQRGGPRMPDRRGHGFRTRQEIARGRSAQKTRGGPQGPLAPHPTRRHAARDH